MSTIKSSFIIIGAIIGAGFASGKEIYEYFAKFGVASLFFVLPLFFCFYYFINILLKLGQKQKNIHIAKINTNLLPTYKNFSIFNVFMFITFLILCSAMASAMVALFKTYFPNISIFFIYFVILIISILLANMSLNKMSEIALFLIPVIILSIVICCIFSISTKGIFLEFNNTIFLAPMTVGYSAQNIFLSSLTIIEIGKISKKEQNKKIALTVSTILSGLVMVCILCFITNPSLGKFDLPFVEIAKSIAPSFSILFGFVMFFSVLTTYVSSLTSLHSYFDGKKKYNKPHMMYVLIVVLSLLNFGAIIEYLYPVIGIFGVIYIFHCRKFCSAN